MRNCPTRRPTSCAVTSVNARWCHSLALGRYAGLTEGLLAHLARDGYELTGVAVFAERRR